MSRARTRTLPHTHVPTAGELQAHLCLHASPRPHSPQTLCTPRGTRLCNARVPLSISDPSNSTVVTRKEQEATPPGAGPAGSDRYYLLPAGQQKAEPPGAWLPGGGGQSLCYLGSSGLWTDFVTHLWAGEGRAVPWECLITFESVCDEWGLGMGRPWEFAHTLLGVSVCVRGASVQAGPLWGHADCPGSAQGDSQLAGGTRALGPPGIT